MRARPVRNLINNRPSRVSACSFCLRRCRRTPPNGVIRRTADNRTYPSRYESPIRGHQTTLRRAISESDLSSVPAEPSCSRPRAHHHLPSITRGLSPAMSPLPRSLSTTMSAV
ncbi:hypothetical protein BC835DRAFT_522044 [Cytidiella melzeri]|nr:hypothetical protein BC835DRAFT_522044 [Cytidiella melzeri]